MELRCERRSGIPVVSFPVSLEIDLSNADEFRRALGESIGDASLGVLDASNVEFFDSAGMGALLSVNRDLENRKGRLVLAGLTRPVQEVFRMVGFDMIFRTYVDVTAAVAACEESS
jgi:anti-anti-sigma factor